MSSDKHITTGYSTESGGASSQINLRHEDVLVEHHPNKISSHSINPMKHHKATYTENDDFQETPTHTRECVSPRKEFSDNPIAKKDESADGMQLSGLSDSRQYSDDNASFNYIEVDCLQERNILPPVPRGMPYTSSSTIKEGEKANENSRHQKPQQDIEKEDKEHYSSPIVSSSLSNPFYVYNQPVSSAHFIPAGSQTAIPAAHSNPNQELHRIYPAVGSGNFSIGVFESLTLYQSSGPTDNVQIIDPIRRVKMTQFRRPQPYGFLIRRISPSLNNANSPPKFEVNLTTTNNRNQSQATPNSTIWGTNLKKGECCNVKIGLILSPNTKLSSTKKENELRQPEDLKTQDEGSRSINADVQSKYEGNCVCSPGKDPGENEKRSQSDFHKEETKNRESSSESRLSTLAARKTSKNYNRRCSASSNPENERSFVQDRDQRVKMGQQKVREESNLYRKLSDMRTQFKRGHNPKYSSLPYHSSRRSRELGQAPIRAHKGLQIKIPFDFKSLGSYTTGYNTSRNYENRSAHGQKVYRNSTYSNNIDTRNINFRNTPSSRPGRKYFKQEASPQVKFGYPDGRTSRITPDTIPSNRHGGPQNQQAGTSTSQKNDSNYRHEYATQVDMKCGRNKSGKQVRFLLESCTSSKNLE